MTTTRPSPYSILLPPGWVRLAVDGTTSHTFQTLINSVVERAPVERHASLRAMLERTVRGALDAATSRDALDLILSFASVEGLPIPVSIATFPVPPPAQDARTPLETLIGLAQSGSRAIEIDGLAAIRRSIDVPAADDSPAHRSVNFVCHVPWLDQWLLFSASILTSDEPGYEVVLTALEGLVDAMISTVRFRREEGAV